MEWNEDIYLGKVKTCHSLIFAEVEKAGGIIVQPTFQYLSQSQSILNNWHFQCINGIYHWEAYEKVKSHEWTDFAFEVEHETKYVPA